MAELSTRGTSGTGQLTRFSQIGRILVRHGFGFLFDVRRERRESRGVQELLAPNFGVRLRRALEELGPTFVKFGQLLSTRSDIFPESVLSELQKLQDAASPVPLEAVQRVIEEELGAGVGEVFSDFDPVPLGSASIGQVHRATLRRGEEVAVKVQRPGARRRIEGDLVLMRELAGFVDTRLGERLFVSVRPLVAEFEGVIRRELDYSVEAENARRFAHNFAGTPVKIPSIHQEFSTPRIITMEFIRGRRFNELRPLSLAPAERRRVASMGADAIFKMAFEDGFFHGDPHPGNLFLTPEGELALLDFGMVGYMSRSDIDALSRLFIAVIRQDAEAVLRGLDDLGVRYEAEVRDDLVQELREFLFKYSGLSVGEVTLGQALSELISLVRRYRLRVPPVFPLLVKALVTAEGISRSIDPTLNVYEVARPYARRLLSERTSPGALSRAARERAVEYSRYVADYPEQVHRLLSELADGELEVRLNHRGLDRLGSQVDVLANRLVFALVTGALLIGSALIGGFVRGGPRVPYLDVPVLAFFGFFLAVVLAVLELVVIFRSGRL
ncbi:ABC1 kinase family protein [Rubrobacter calidifluminis]|uniref:ABC1 kinase family protein n=1 Tax=Rubrobacter calidifluminis TaxID=1392640 RepID=UPI00236278D9|nr:AarF/ABC1/UbiB kinase family protein [Rubrobacter calidifluminis]